jgi:hypothetical protein
MGYSHQPFQGDQMFFENKFAQFLVQNIYMATLLRPWNSYNKLCFETACLGENVGYLLIQKVAQNVAISLGFKIFLLKL